MIRVITQVNLIMRRLLNLTLLVLNTVGCLRIKRSKEEGENAKGEEGVGRVERLVGG